MSFRRSSLATVALSALAYTALAASPTASPFRFDGAWRITRIAGYSEVSVGSDQARRLVGRTVTIGPKELRIGDDNCVPDTVNTGTRATAPLLLNQYHAGLTDAGVAPHTLVLDAGRCGHVFRVGADIVVFQGGAFYRAMRAVSAHDGQ